MGHGDAADNIGAEVGHSAESWDSLGLGEDGLAAWAEKTLVQPAQSARGRPTSPPLLPVRRGLGSLFVAGRPADDAMFVLSSPASSAMLAIHGYETFGDWAKGRRDQRRQGRPDLDGEAREGVHDLLATLS